VVLDIGSCSGSECPLRGIPLGNEALIRLFFAFLLRLIDQSAIAMMTAISRPPRCHKSITYPQEMLQFFFGPAVVSSGASAMVISPVNGNVREFYAMGRTVGKRQMAALVHLCVLLLGISLSIRPVHLRI
jgi:hypothetical protein